MSKKASVVNDVLNSKTSNGIYCVMPFERKDKAGKCIFKIGMTTKTFAERIDMYHTYYPLGVYLVCFLVMKSIKKVDRTKLYLEIEKYIMDKIVKQNGIQILSGARVPNNNSSLKKGETEFFYTTYNVIINSFKDASEKYNQNLTSLHIRNINYNYEHIIKKSKIYIAEIVFDVSKNQEGAEDIK